MSYLLSAFCTSVVKSRMKWSVATKMKMINSVIVFRCVQAECNVFRIIFRFEVHLTFDTVFSLNQPSHYKMICKEAKSISFEFSIFISSSYPLLEQ